MSNSIEISYFLENLDEAFATLNISMKIGDWEKVSRDLDKNLEEIGNHQVRRLVGRIQELVKKAHNDFQQTVDWNAD